MTIDDLSPEQRDRILAGLSSSPSGPELRGVARKLSTPIAELARQSGLGYDRAERLLNGRASPRPDELRRIERVLGLPERERASA
jgi:transcriptional regulator with XRE-family HTH domain